MRNDKAAHATARVDFYVFVGLGILAWLGAAVLYFN